MPPADSQEYKGFLSRAWFSKENAGALRSHLKVEILKCFIEDVRPRRNSPSQALFRFWRLAAIGGHLTQVRQSQFQQRCS